MCLAMYLFTNDALPESEWSKDHPGVWIQEVKEGDDRGALKWPHEQNGVYYIGGFEGCGCGWSPVDEFDEPDEVSKKQEDRKKLAELVESVDLRDSWLVVCWEGEQGEPLLEAVTIGVHEIANVEFEQLRKYLFAWHMPGAMRSRPT